MSEWSGIAEAYRTSFATLCGGTIERLLADTPSGCHLDVGSGTGALAAEAARRGRRVVALDEDRDMVGMTSAAVLGQTVSASLPRLPFGDGAFDAVTANFVINHVADPRASLRDLARVARPDGTVAVTVWPSEPSAWAVTVAQAFSAAGVLPTSSQRLSPLLDFERSVDGLRGLAESAGLEVITATELRWDWVIDCGALWGGIAAGVTTMGRTYLAQTPEVRVAAEHAFREAMAPLSSTGTLRLASTAAYVVAAARHTTR